MLIALLRLLRYEPHLAAEQLECYGQLVADRVGAITQGLRRRLVLQLVGWACIALAPVLAGVALLLWAAVPHDSMPVPWLLLAVPLVPALIGVFALSASPASLLQPTLQMLREQIALDAAALRQSSRRAEHVTPEGVR